MNNDLISRKALKKAMSEWETFNDGQQNACISISRVLKIIDNAPAVDTSKSEQEAYKKGYTHGAMSGFPSRIFSTTIEVNEKGGEE